MVFLEASPSVSAQVGAEGFVFFVFGTTRNNIGNAWKLATHSQYGQVWQNDSGRTLYGIVSVEVVFSVLSANKGGKEFDLRTGTSLTAGGSVIKIQQTPVITSSTQRATAFWLLAIPANTWLTISMTGENGDIITTSTTRLAFLGF